MDTIFYLLIRTNVFFKIVSVRYQKYRSIFDTWCNCWCLTHGWITASHGFVVTFIAGFTCAIMRRGTASRAWLIRVWKSAMWSESVAIIWYCRSCQRECSDQRFCIRSWTVRWSLVRNIKCKSGNRRNDPSMSILARSKSTCVGRWPWHTIKITWAGATSTPFCCSSSVWLVRIACAVSKAVEIDTSIGSDCMEKKMLWIDW